MRPPKSRILAEKSVEACLAAIEVYNKPAFKYREETFAILMINAWELLLKARVLQHNRNRITAIEVMEKRKNKGGAEGKRLVAKTSRSGNHLTIGISKAMELVRQYTVNSIDERVIENIHLLVEIRDNAVHLRNDHPALKQRVHQIGSASLRNFAKAVQDWFDIDVADFSFFLMPIAFVSPSGAIDALARDSKASASGKLLALIDKKEHDYPFDEGNRYNLAIKMELRLVRSQSTDAIAVRVTRDPNAPQIQLSEENIRQSFPWDYAELCDRMKSGFSDFKIDKKFHRLRKTLETNDSLCKARHLDPAKPTASLTKRFYNPNILSELGKSYTAKSNAPDKA